MTESSDVLRHHKLKQRREALRKKKEHLMALNFGFATIALKHSKARERAQMGKDRRPSSPSSKSTAVDVSPHASPGAATEPKAVERADSYVQRFGLPVRFLSHAEMTADGVVRLQRFAKVLFPAADKGIAAAFPLYHRLWVDWRRKCGRRKAAGFSAGCCRGDRFRVFHRCRRDKRTTAGRRAWLHWDGLCVRRQHRPVDRVAWGLGPKQN